ncbi:hypothetical protein [Nibribacter koreensis]|uniref:hypothetical protein n=1 Tax=Nibribacter koreensis TaxID=1084519 RepID=UPI0031E604BA
MKIRARLRLYLKQAGYFLAGLLFIFMVGAFLRKMNVKNSSAIMVLLSLLLFIGLQISTGYKLLPQGTKGRWRKLVTITFLVVMLLLFKTYYNEVANLSLSCIGKMSDTSRVMNYIGFSLWISFGIWEGYLLLAEKLKSSGTIKIV